MFPYEVISMKFLIYTSGLCFLLAHWLAIEGKQPTINENPEIISKSDLTTDSLDPVRRLNSFFSSLY